MAAEINPIRRGDTLIYNVKLIDEESGNPIPANGTLIFTLKSDQTEDDPGALQHLVNRDDDDVNDPDGLLYLEVPSEKTVLLEPDFYYYDFQFISAAGKITTLLPTIGQEEIVQVYDHTTHMEIYTP